MHAHIPHAPRRLRSAVISPLVALALVAGVQEAEAQRTAPVADGTVYTLTAGPMSVVAGPTKGGRIRSLKFEGTELFYQDSSGNPSSHGSTFWPSPQAHWTNNCRNSNNNGCWPPPSSLDGSNTTYTGALLAADTAVTFFGALDNGTGVRLRKTLWADSADTSVTIRYHIVNGSSNKVAFAPWEVTRFTSGGLLFWPKDETDTIKGNGTAGAAMIAMVTDTLDTKWFKYDSATVPTNGTPKLWDGSTGGWFARVDKSRLLYIKKFTDTPKAKKAPVNENEIEIYSANRSGATGGMALLEMELQGPFDSIAVGDSLEWDVTWLVRRLPESISIAPGTALLDFVDAVVNGSTVSLRPGARAGHGAAHRLNVAAGGVSFTLGEAAAVTLEVMDARGRITARLHAGTLAEGTHSFRLAPGTHGVRWVVLRDAQARVLDTRMIAPF